MKICIIDGSARKKNTRKVIEAFKNELSALVSVDFFEINVHDLDLPFCKSCYVCFFKGEESCPHQEIIQPIYKEMISSDGVIIASPAYSLQVTAALKNLIDHFSFIIHRPGLSNKKGVVISTTAGAGHKEVAKYLSQILSFWGVDKVYAFPVRVAAEELEIKKGLQKKIKRYAGQFFRDISQRRRYNPSMKNLFYFSVMKAFYQLGKEEQTLDYRYWRDRGWFELDFFHPIGFPKNLMGRTLYSLLTWVFRKKL